MADCALSKYVFDPSDLPPMPVIASQLLKTADLEEIDINKLAESIRKDPALSARILRVVNSPFYCFAHKIGTISQALVALGTRATRSLVLSYSVLSLTPRDSADVFDYRSFWCRSLTAATTAREIALAVGMQAEEAFLAGLLQDIGMIAMAQRLLTRYADVVKRAQNSHEPMVLLERDAFATDHATVGRHLLETWNFPEELILPVFHHHDSLYRNIASDLKRQCAVQYVSSELCDWLYGMERREDVFEGILKRAEQDVGLSPSKLVAVLEKIDESVRSNAALFDVEVTRSDTYMGLVRKASSAVQHIVEEQEFRIRKLEADFEDATKLTYQLRTVNRELLDETRRDALTGLANRKALEASLAREISRLASSGISMGVLFVDIDRFKTVNDTLGHAVGDEVLKAVAVAITEAVREKDLVARYGGEEFVVVLTDADESSIRRIAERVRLRVQQKDGDRIGSVPITVSVGAASCSRVKPNQSGELIIRAADSAMYEAKKSGRNKVCFCAYDG